MEREDIPVPPANNAPANNAPAQQEVVIPILKRKVKVGVDADIKNAVLADTQALMNGLDAESKQKGGRAGYSALTERDYGNVTSFFIDYLNGLKSGKSLSASAQQYIKDLVDKRPDALRVLNQFTRIYRPNENTNPRVAFLVPEYKAYVKANKANQVVQVAAKMYRAIMRQIRNRRINPNSLTEAYIRKRKAVTDADKVNKVAMLRKKAAKMIKYRTANLAGSAANIGAAAKTAVEGVATRVGESAASSATTLGNANLAQNAQANLDAYQTALSELGGGAGKVDYITRLQGLQ